MKKTKISDFFSYFNVKNIIAIGVLFLSAIILLMLTSKVLRIETNDAHEVITKSVLPLIATWMGAIIAYYFAKESFDVSSKQTDKLIDKLTLEKRLESLRVADTMIPLSEMIYLELANHWDKKVFSGILGDKNMKGYNRFLFFSNLKCKYVIHRSILDRYVSLKLETMSVEAIKNLTLHELIEEKDQRIKKYVHEGVSFLALSSCLLDAKKMMDENSFCQDIIITRTGKPHEDVMGWIPNTTMAEYAKL